MYWRHRGSCDETEDYYCFGGGSGSGVRSGEAEDDDGAYASAAVPRPGAEGSFARRACPRDEGAATEIDCGLLW
jgi:hypothetical protein